MTAPAPAPGSALVTGAGKRIGAEICRVLHDAGYRVLIHYRQSADAAEALRRELNDLRADSAACISADLADSDQAHALAEQVAGEYPDLSTLVNNASSFYATPLATASNADWDNLFKTNLHSPFLLCQGLADTLVTNLGSIVNLVDIYAKRPLTGFSVYSATKAGLGMLTRSLAAELAPCVRVNGIAPGAILMPDDDWGSDELQLEKLLRRIPLGRLGASSDIANLVLFLARDASYVTGQVIAVDGGRSA